MAALKILFGALAGVVIGWIAAAAATILLGGMFGLTEFEGQRSMTAMFGAGPVGGVIGLIAGLWIAVRSVRRSAAGGV
jgi:hypothetical protein